MAYQEINDRESGLTVRQKINTMLEDLYDSIAGIAGELWEAVSGDSTRISPKDSKGISTPHLRVGGAFPNQVNVNSLGVYLPALATGMASGDTRILVIDHEGKITVFATGLLVHGTGGRKFGVPDEVYIDFNVDGMQIVDASPGGIALVADIITIGNLIIKDTAAGTSLYESTETAGIAMDDNNMYIDSAVEMNIRINEVSKIFINSLGITLQDTVSFEKIPRIKSGANIISSIFAGFTLSATDVGKYFRHTGASNITVTVPESLNWYNGESARFRRTAAGDIIIQAATGNVTLNHKQDRTQALHDVIEIIKVSTNEYDIINHFA